MKTTTIRLEDQMYAELKSLAAQLGVSFSTLANAALQKTLREKKIELSLPEYTMNPKYEEELINDPDAHETVFVARNPGESRKFLTSLVDD